MCIFEVKHYGAQAPPICILENTNFTNCTNHHADRDLLIAYKLHESMREDNANVETSYYGVS